MHKHPKRWILISAASILMGSASCGDSTFEPGTTRIEGLSASSKTFLDVQRDRFLAVSVICYGPDLESRPVNKLFDLDLDGRLRKAHNLPPQDFYISAHYFPTLEKVALVGTQDDRTSALWVLDLATDRLTGPVETGLDIVSSSTADPERGVLIISDYERIEIYDVRSTERLARRDSSRYSTAVLVGAGGSLSFVEGARVVMLAPPSYEQETSWSVADVPRTARGLLAVDELRRRALTGHFDYDYEQTQVAVSQPGRQSQVILQEDEAWEVYSFGFSDGGQSFFLMAESEFTNFYHETIRVYDAEDFQRGSTRDYNARIFARDVDGTLLAVVLDRPAILRLDPVSLEILDRVTSDGPTAETIQLDFTSRVGYTIEKTDRVRGISRTCQGRLRSFDLDGLELQE